MNVLLTFFLLVVQCIKFLIDYGQEGRWGHHNTTNAVRLAIQQILLALSTQQLVTALAICLSAVHSRTPISDFDNLLDNDLSLHGAAIAFVDFVLLHWFFWKDQVKSKTQRAASGIRRTACAAVYVTANSSDISITRS